jgi:hypothetical protein
MGNSDSQQLYQGKIQEDYILVNQVGHHGAPAYPSCVTFGKKIN